MRKKIIIGLVIGAFICFSLLLFLLVAGGNKNNVYQKNIVRNQSTVVSYEDLKKTEKTQGGVFSRNNKEDEVEEEIKFVAPKNDEDIDKIRKELENSGESLEFKSSVIEEEKVSVSTKKVVVQKQQAERPVVKKVEKEPLLSNDEIKEEPKAKIKTNRFFKNSKKDELANSVLAVVHGLQTVSNKSTLKIRLKDDFKTNDGLLIAKGTYIYGTVSLTEERINVSINNVRIGKNIYPFKMDVYDMDGIEGINMPESVRADIAKQAQKRAIQDARIDAGGGVVGAAVNTGVALAKEGINLSTQTIKVDIKNNYQILLR